MDFQNYYRRLGLQNYPFSTFTTEHETTHAEELFVPMTEQQRAAEQSRYSPPQQSAAASSGAGAAPCICWWRRTAASTEDGRPRMA